MTQPILQSEVPAPPKKERSIFGKAIWILLGLIVIGLFIGGTATRTEAGVVDDVTGWLMELFGYESPEDVPQEILNSFIEITPTTSRKCVNGKCEFIQYSGIRFIYEDDTWKKTEDARSWKGSGIRCEVISDGINIAECLDWNYTSRIVKLERKSNAINIPLRKYSLDEDKKRIYDSKFATTLSFNVEQEKEFLIKATPNERIEFGEHSTELILNESDSENAEDARVYATDSTTNYGSEAVLATGGTIGVAQWKTFIKFTSIQDITAGSKLENVDLNLYAHEENDNIVQIDAFTNQSWKEERITWAIHGSEAGFAPEVSNLDTTTVDTVNQWYKWNVTNWTQSRFDYGDNNISFILHATNENAIAVFHSKEYNTVTSLRPYLNITYTSPSGTVDLQAPANETVAFQGSVNFTYNMTDPLGAVKNCSLFLQHSFGDDWEKNFTDTTITETIHQTINITLAYENIYWKVGCWDSTDTQLNSSARNYTRLQAIPLIDLQAPADTATVESKNINFIYNVSVNVGSIDSCSLWLNGTLNQTDYNVEQIINQTFEVSINNTRFWNWLIQCNDTMNTYANSSTFSFIANNVPTTPTAVSPINNTIIVKNSIDLSCSDSTDAEGDTIIYEFWNGTTSSNMKVSQNSSLQTFNLALQSPQHHYWKCKTHDNISQSAAFSPTRKLTYAKLDGNCSGTNATDTLIYNFTWQDESNFTRIYDVNYESVWIIRGNDTTNNFTTSIERTAINETLVCMSPKNATSFRGSVLIEYSKEGYETRNYIINNQLISIINQNITLFTTLTTLTTEVSITVTDAQDRPLSGVIVEAHMYDIGTDTFSLVQTETTNPQGELKMNLIQGKFFIFKFYEGGLLVDETVSFKLTSTELTFKISVSEESLEPDKQIGNLFQRNISFVNATLNLTFNFSSADKVDGLSSVCWAVQNLSTQRQSVLYTKCFTITNGEPSSGIDSYILPAFSKKETYRAHAYGFVKGFKYLFTEIELIFRQVPTWGGEGLLLGLFLVMTLGGLGLATKNPAATIMMVLFGVIISWLVGLWALTWIGVSSLIIVGLVLLYISKT